MQGVSCFLASGDLKRPSWRNSCSGTLYPDKVSVPPATEEHSLKSEFLSALQGSLSPVVPVRTPLLAGASCAEVSV